MKAEKLKFHALSQRETAEAHEVSVRTIQLWTAAGMPREEDGRYRLAATIRWRARNTSTNGSVDLAGRTYRRHW